jgi:hypothetical protein
MRDQLVLLLAGFGLTTVAGGLLGYWLQARSWRRQEADRLRQAQLHAAALFYEELSRLLDRRLHRMRQLDGRLERDDRAEVERLLAAYRAVVDDWNENLNRNLALAMSYFGAEVHSALELLYEQFAAAGSAIELRVREGERGGTSATPAVTDELRELDLAIYDLNRRMLQALQTGSIGLTATAP